MDIDDGRTHQYGIDMVRRTKSGIHLTNNKIKSLIEGDVEVGKWFSIKVSKSSKGKLTITLEEETEE